jgi:hypothetical protein
MPFFVWLGAMIIVLILKVYVDRQVDKMNAQATPRENRVVQRTPRPHLEEWQEGNTICYGVIYKGSKPIIPSPSERYDPTQRQKRLHFVEINGQKYEVRV